MTFAAMQDRDVLVGVGADSVERGIDHRAFAPAFAMAADAGLRRTIHAGEDGPVENIRIAIEDLGCERVDHGFRLLDDDDLTQRVVDEGIAMTSCPLSNVLIGRLVPDVRSHPFDEQRRRGVRATLNSDDPAMMGTDLVTEYLAVQEAFGYSIDDLERVSLDAVEASFAPREEQRELDRRFRSQFDALRGQASVVVP